MGTYQNVNGSQPVLVNDPPPEGPMAAQLAFTLTAVSPGANASLQLNSPGGLQLSQVVTLVIDNSENQYAVQVTHGAFNENTIVPAFGTVIVPTFSSQGGNYTLLVTAEIPGGTLSANLLVNIIMLNYSRTPGSFGNTTISSIIGGAGQNTSPLASDVYSFTGVGSVIVLPAGNYILDSMDFAFEGMQATASASMSLKYTLDCGGVLFAAGFAITGGTVGMWTGGAQISSPQNRTWPLGMVLPRGGKITLTVLTVTNVTNAILRVNISGVNTP